ncbi:MAG: Trk system potassium transporter TrkA [Bacillota bacterium]|nr:Trk system potassium transporter TrkA [Bacillota bacterium]
MKVAIAGAGKLGLALTEALLGGGNAVTLIDKNQELLQKISGELDLLTVAANAKEISVLKEMKIQNYDYLVATTDRDEKNLVICALAKALGCPKVIARARDPEHMKQFDFLQKTFQIDYLVNPDLAIANAIYKYLVEKYTLSNGYFSTGKISIIEFAAKRLPSIIDKNLMEIAQYLEGMLVVAVDHYGKLIIPRGSTLVQEDDILYVLGLEEPIMKLNETVHEKNPYTDLQRVMIAGGGKTGFYLARQLADFGISVKLIEIDRRRCEYLSEHLDDVLVLHGDATDPTLLEEENIDEMDAFVTVTGFDEENLLLALLANQRDIEDVVAKVSRKSYISLIQQMGISALNPLDITATNILRFIQGSKRILFSKMIQGQAEFIEVVADEHTKVLNTPLSKLELPEGIIIAAIHRGEEAIIPRGQTEILKGDKVISLCLLSQISKFEQLFLRTRK